MSWAEGWACCIACVAWLATQAGKIWGVSVFWILSPDAIPWVWSKTTGWVSEEGYCVSTTLEIVSLHTRLLEFVSKKRTSLFKHSYHAESFISMEYLEEMLSDSPSVEFL